MAGVRTLATDQAEAQLQIEVDATVREVDPAAGRTQARPQPHIIACFVLHNSI